ncbi:MAG: NAD(P)/FAD-dependent oxidoreductase, partial [Verrucomicrobiota bacterium]
PSRPVFQLMRAYNRRFASIARHRRHAGMLGKTNRGRRCLIPGFTLKGGDFQGLVGALATWLWLELREGWRSWRRPAAVPETAIPPVPATE